MSLGVQRFEVLYLSEAENCWCLTCEALGYSQPQRREVTPDHKSTADPGPDPSASWALETRSVQPVKCLPCQTEPSAGWQGLLSAGGLSDLTSSCLGFLVREVDE